MFDIAVIGNGMLGASAAAFLQSRGFKTALIGASAPDFHSETAVYSSHYDQARITRRIDSDPFRRQLSELSIELYAEFERRSGVAFHRPCGVLVYAPKEISDSLEDYRDEELEGVELLSEEELGERFPAINSSAGEGLYEGGAAGTIHPLQMIEACNAVFEMDGGELFSAQVSALDKQESKVLSHSSAGVIESRQVLLAAGAFSESISFDEQLKLRAQLKARANTYLLVEVDPELPLLETALIYRDPDPSKSVYLTPATLHPDGKTYIKIGHSLEGHEFEDIAELRQWFAGEGSETMAQELASRLAVVLPQLSEAQYSRHACVTTSTSTGRPLIDIASGRPFNYLLGGNGFCAKCALGLGRVAAELFLGELPPVGAEEFERLL